MDDPSSSTLLNELCSVCNTTKFKYRCPGCDARTCSLPCYKRHQQWAQCSGRRDPTKFVKKSQLLTPAGIDHDYNFLSQIERNMDKADRVAANATVAAPEQGLSNRQRAGVPYSKLEMAAGVTIIRAPQGLSRQRDNKSHMSATKKASRNIVWTVEWIDDASSRRVLTQTSSVQLIKDAQPFAQPHGTEAKSKKRKLNIEAPAPVPAPAPAVTTPDASQSQHYYAKPVAEIQEQSLLPFLADAETPIDHASQRPVSPGRGNATPRGSDQGQASAKGQTDVPDIHHSHPDHDERAPQPMDRGRQPKFFLLKPRTSTTRKVLIPLDSSSTIAESLRGRTVLEFPTIHMFPPDLGELPKDEFMLEEEYAELEGEQQKEFDELMGELDPDIVKRLKEGEEGASRDGVGAVGEEEVDSKKILDVLKQDLGRRL